MSKVNTTTILRIKKEIANAVKSKNKQIYLKPCIGNSLHNWRAILRPSKESIFHDMYLEVSIVLPETYPYNPPHITFLTDIFHPNINRSGSICISTLNKDWSPALTIENTLLSIVSLLDSPNAEDPLRGDASDLYLNDYEEYCRKCREVWDRCKKPTWGKRDEYK